MSENEKRYLVKGSLVMFVRTAGAGLTLALTVYLAKMLGAGGYGVFSLSLTIITIVSVLARFGLDNVVMKNVAITFESNPELASGYIVGALRFIAVTGSTLTLMIWLISLSASKDLLNHAGFNEVLAIMSFLVVPISLSFIISEALKSVMMPIASATLYSLTTPFFAIIGLLIIHLLGLVNVKNAVVVYLAASLITLILFFIALVATKLKLRNIRAVSWINLAKQGWPLLLISSGSLLMTWTDIIILGVMSDADSLGVYSISSRLVLVSNLFLIAANSLVAPQYAILFHKNKIKKMRDLANKVSFVLMLLSFVASAVLFVSADELLHFMGKSFEAGTQIIAILLIGQIVNVSCGSVSVILIVSGNENILRNIFFATGIFNIIISLVCVKLYGVVGVAFATSASLVLWNVWAVVEIRKKLGFWSLLSRRLS